MDMKYSKSHYRAYLLMALVFSLAFAWTNVNGMSSSVPSQTSWGDATPPVMCHHPVVTPFDHTADAQSSAPILSIDVLIGSDISSAWLNGLEVHYSNNRTVTTLTETRTVQRAGTATFTASDPLVEVYGTYSQISNVITGIYFRSLSGRVSGPFCQKGGAKGPAISFSLRGASNTSIIGFKGVNKNNEWGTWKVGMLEIITAPLSGSSQASAQSPSQPSTSGQSSTSTSSQSSTAVSNQPSTSVPTTSAPVTAPVQGSLQSDTTAFFNAINSGDWFTARSILGRYASNVDSLSALLTAQKPVTNERINGVMTTPLHVAVSKNNSYIVTQILNNASTVGTTFLRNLVLQRDGANKQPIDYADPNSSLAISLRYRMNI